jgi:hemolysin activation/secretion protein
VKFRILVAGHGALLLTLAATFPAHAQNVPAVPHYGIGDAVRQGEESRQPPLPAPAAAPILVQPVEPPLTLKNNETLTVRTIQVEGPNLASEAEIRAVLAPYENRALTLVQIYEAADKVTTLYRGHGYLVAKAYVPAQDARGGVLRFKLVPGQYGTITTKNESPVRDGFLHGVIDQAVGGSPLVHKDELERAMLLVSDLPGAGVPRIAIGPGQQPETSDFVFGVPQAPRVDGYLLGDNFGSPYTGRYRASGGLNLNSPLGYGDRLSGFAIVSQDANLVNGRLAYAFPLGYSGLRGEIAAFRTTYALGGGYKAIDATGIADGVTATLSYPLKRQQDDSIFISGAYTHKALNDKIFGTSIADRAMDLGTAAITRDTAGALIGLPLVTTTTLSFTSGNVSFSDPAQKAENIAGVDTEGNFARLNLSFSGTAALTEKLSLSTNIAAQKSLMGNLDSSEQMSLTGFWGVRSFDEGLAGDSGYLVTPELKYALPDIGSYRHSIGAFLDVGAVWLENAAFTTTQKSHTQLSDGGLGYYATYEYSPKRFLLLKALAAQTIGSSDGAQSYDRGTKGLVQIGVTF